MKLLDRYERELLEAARRLERERPHRARRVLVGAGRGLGWTLGAIALAGAAAVTLAVTLTISGGGREADRLPAGPPYGSYASTARPLGALHKDAPGGSTLLLGADGRYRLTASVYRFWGRYRRTTGGLEFVSARRFGFLPGLRTRGVDLPRSAGCRTGRGVYRVREARDSITFGLVHDPCRARASIVAAAPWLRTRE